jgi:hypothetical protein
MGSSQQVVGDVLQSIHFDRKGVELVVVAAHRTNCLVHGLDDLHDEVGERSAG